MKASDLRTYAHYPARFADTFVKKNEKGKLWSLTTYQRRVLALAFRWSAAGRLLLRLLLWSEPKKSGKTFLAALLGLWWAFTNPRTEVIVVANDLEQSVSRVFATMVALCQLNPALRESVTIRATSILVSNGTSMTAIASEYRGAAGSRHSLVIFDELWGFTSENGQRLCEELTPPPTEPDAWVLVVRHAGFVNESKLLEAIYQRGLAGERIDTDLEVYRAGELVMFWSHVPRQPWQTDQYYQEQRRSLRPNTYLRLHENRWATAESIFVTPALWDACTDAALRPELTCAESVFVGVDAAWKRDGIGIVAVRWESDRLRLVCHRISRPTASAPLNIEATAETFLRELHARYTVALIYADPFQFVRSIQTLEADGLPIRAFNQTAASTCRMGQELFSLLHGANLRMYPSEDLREQALSAVAIETANGFRLAKEKASKKIDGIAALSMACFAALDGKESIVELRFLGPSAPQTALEIQSEADRDFAERREAAKDAVTHAIQRHGVYWPGG
jgi:phage terminase large subunit-like protein